MPKPIADLNNPNSPGISLAEIKSLISRDLVDEMQTKFGLIGKYSQINLSMSKVLYRYQSAVFGAQDPPVSPQTKQIDRLDKAIVRTLTAFEAISKDNRYNINEETLYRDPFNSRFLFDEQLEYWEKNENSTEMAINKLAQISFAISKIKAKKEAEVPVYTHTINTPLDHLIQDLMSDFESGTNGKARCYHNDVTGQYQGNYFEFIVFILSLFAPKSYHSDVALGERIKRALAKALR